MSYHRGGGGSGGGGYSGSGGGGYPSKKPNDPSSQRSFSMNAVPPPSSLMGRPNVFQKSITGGSGGGANKANTTGLSKHGYTTMDAISQFANSSQYAVGKRKSKTEDE